MGTLPHPDDPRIGAIRNVALDIAYQKGRVDIDDLREAMPNVPGDARVFGNALLTLTRRGLLKPVDWKPSRQTRNHQRPIRVFQLVGACRQ